MRPLYGKFLGKVEDVDDPKKMRRIRTSVPEIAGTELIGWALPCDAFPTDWLPVQGDFVWVEFRAGDIDSPLWVGLAVAKNKVSSEFLAKYGNAYRRDRDANGNTIEWTADGSSQGAFGIRINGTKRLANEDLVAWLKTNLLDWLKGTICPWLRGHQHVGNMGAPTPLFPADTASMIVIENAYTATIADYETKRAAGGANLTDKVKAG